MSTCSLTFAKRSSYALAAQLSITIMSEKLDAPTSSADMAVVNGGPKAVIKNVDMSEEMQQEAVDVASVALEKYNIEKDIAAQIKKEFDRRHGPTWHVVVGKNFGSYVTHGEYALLEKQRVARVRLAHSMPLLTIVTLSFLETKHFIYFYIGQLAILIWKS